MSTARALRSLITSPQLEFIMEAHNALSATIVEESGFPAIWGSGLSISASLGLPDRNIASWSQVLDVVSYMVDATGIPLLLDGDTGFGNCNNVQHVVRKLCHLGVAGVCFEDKLFPKTNSFLSAGKDLANADEFAGRIRAAQDAKTDSDFCVVARVEALISGCGLSEALERAHLYVENGADAILIHSRKADASEILEFCEHWKNHAPVVVVPTKYYLTPTDAFRDAAISCVIWANHSLRASISALRSITQTIRSEESVAQIETQIASLDDVFALTAEANARAAEERYLPQ